MMLGYKSREKRGNIVIFVTENVEMMGFFLGNLDFF